MENSCLGKCKSEYEREIHLGLCGTTDCPFEIYGHKIYETSQYSGCFVQQCLAASGQEPSRLLLTILAGVY